jgi:hypothetical protein
MTTYLDTTTGEQRPIAADDRRHDDDNGGGFGGVAFSDAKCPDHAKGGTVSGH